MMQHPISWERLNAYVDGELSAGEAAKIARAVMRDSQLAARVAELAQLKAASSSVRLCPDEALDLDLDGIRPPRRRFAQAAAWLLLPAVMLLLAGLWFSPGFRNTDSEIAQALAVHHQWLNTASSRSLRDDSGHFLKTSLDMLGIRAFIPDLTSAHLEFAGIYPVTRPGAALPQALHVGYLGPSGCKLSLLVTQRDTKDFSPLETVREDRETVYRWQIGQTGFLLLASHMDAARFEQIAQVLYRLTHIRKPLDASSLVALNRAKANSTPCAA